MIYKNMINQTKYFCRGLSHKVFQRKWKHKIKRLTESPRHYKFLIHSQQLNEKELHHGRFPMAFALEVVWSTCEQLFFK